MADYKAIHGKNIQHLASDLDSAEGEGQIWFNTTSSDYKTIVKLAGTWSTGGALNTGRKENLGGAGTSNNAALIFGGTPPVTGATEKYDGSSWSEVADLSTARGQLAGAMASPSSASLAMGGREPAKSVATEEWDKAVAASSFTSS